MCNYTETFFCHGKYNVVHKDFIHISHIYTSQYILEVVPFNINNMKTSQIQIKSGPMAVNVM